ncbi:21 kDa subunit of NADH dehydrogenase [Ascodesmis nigricans]|uniref:21 kDa subunit of NADH dehydrogenase n=1 Tax=Ascodesmis nigricans TaxID=341454 RepID=A0A4S2ML11_9PEZI|nr:21 kDa subunit of NADH dehydrogenase [Ascodesmis nigricans]
MPGPNTPGGVVSVYKKYTVGSVGIWEKIRRFFAIDPNRSSGVPLNPTYRNPAPGSLRATQYTDPVTIPAGDIADNPYWKRDVRRNYARTSVFEQNDVAGLLTIGSRAAPRIAVGKEGERQLVEVQNADKGVLAAVLEKSGEVVKGEVLGKDGMPPLPGSGWKFELLQEQSYPPQYPCRSFV